MAQLYLYAHHYGAVYPLLGGDAACLPHYGTQVTLRETQTLGIVVYMVVLSAVQVGKLYKTVKDGLLTRA